MLIVLCVSCSNVFCLRRVAHSSVSLPRVAPSIMLFNATPDAGIFKSNEQCIKLVLHEVTEKEKNIESERELLKAPEFFHPTAFHKGLAFENCYIYDVIRCS